MAQTQTFRCTLITPQQEVLDDDVVYASIPAWDGLMGLMVQRSPLLVKLGDGLLRLDFPKGGSRWFFVGGGFAQMADNKLSLVTPEAKAPDDIDRAQAQAALTQASTATQDDDGFTRVHRDQQRARAMIQLLDHHTN